MITVKDIKTRFRSLINNVFRTRKKSVGIVNSINREDNTLNVNNTGVKYISHALRIPTGTTNIKAELTNITGFIQSNDNGFFEIWLNPTTAGNALNFQPINGSSLEYALGNGGNGNVQRVTGGQLIDTFYLAQNKELNRPIERPIEIKENDILVFTIQTFSNGMDALSGSTWDEYEY